MPGDLSSLGCSSLFYRNRISRLHNNVNFPAAEHFLISCFHIFSISIPIPIAIWTQKYDVLFLTQHLVLSFFPCLSLPNLDYVARSYREGIFAEKKFPVLPLDPRQTKRYI